MTAILTRVQAHAIVAHTKHTDDPEAGKATFIQMLNEDRITADIVGTWDIDPEGTVHLNNWMFTEQPKHLHGSVSPKVMEINCRSAVRYEEQAEPAPTRPGRFPRTP